MWLLNNNTEALIDKYMPSRGEGETIASQVCTAINKLVYKWFNDGDVYDNTAGGMNGWLNDLSSYANWIHHYMPAEAGRILEKIWKCYSAEEYEYGILKPLAEQLLTEDRLAKLAEKPAVGSIYKCDGPFEFICNDEDEENW